MGPTKPAAGVTAVFSDAGHILGSAIVALDLAEEGQERRLVFSGDLGRQGMAILRDPETLAAADFLIMESTYGNRRHETRDEARQVFAVRRILEAEMVRTVAQGRKYVTPEIAQMLVESLTSPVAEQAHEKLSDRELQTLVMIASGKRLSDIAAELTLSPKTVSVYRARVLEKLGLTNNSEMTVYAIRNGLVGD